MASPVLAILMAPRAPRAPSRWKKAAGLAVIAANRMRSSPGAAVRWRSRFSRKQLAAAVAAVAIIVILATDSDMVCTAANVGGLEPVVPWAAATDGTELSICLSANVTAAVGTPSTHPTITVANAGELWIGCEKPASDAAADPEAELCIMMDRLHATAAATLFLRGLLFQDLLPEPRAKLLP